jgi:thioredoxin 1
MFKEITDATFAASVADGLHIVLFYKDQCPFCRAMKKIITKFSERPTVADKAIGYLQINRETNPEAAAVWEVERIPTVLVFRQGEKIHARSGDLTYRDLERMVA